MTFSFKLFKINSRNTIWLSNYTSFTLSRNLSSSATKPCALNYQTNIFQCRTLPRTSDTNSRTRFNRTLHSRYLFNKINGNMPPIIDKGQSPVQIIEKCIAENKVMIFSKSTCPFCLKVKRLFANEKIPYESLELDGIENGNDVQNALQELTGQRTVPNIYIQGKHVGDSSKVFDLYQTEELFGLLHKKTHNYDYDYVVIGGGSGGLASSKEAAKYGAKVAVCDFVTPTPKGTKWGLGGTCVNVGCIPKKLMHQAALLGHGLMDAREFGWNLNENNTHDWGKMVEGIQNHIGSLNWAYRVDLKDKKVDYLNSFASFIDPHTIKTVDKKGEEKTLTADKFLIAVGGRPRYPDVPGAKEYCITSDDIFSLPHAPGKTLLIGASYIALECAGFLAGLGYDVTVMVRSILLRGFDQQMADKIGKIMANSGVKFIRETVPTKIEQVEEGSPGKLRVTGVGKSGVEFSDEFNTVVVAVGRDPCTPKLALEKAQVAVSKNSKIIVDKSEMTSQSNIFAVGDVIEGGLELTPVAIHAGKLLARRLYGNSTALTNYTNVPTTVFTPVEYGSCGFSEEGAVEKFGAEDIEVYHSGFWPLEFTVAHRPENDCYAKLIVHKEGVEERVVGFHYIGPNAGEVTQGFSIALKLGATKAQFDDLIGIHPTTAEIFTTMTITKRSGEDAGAKGC